MVNFCPSDSTPGGKGEFGQLLGSIHSFQCKGFAGTSFWTVEVHPLLTFWPNVAVYLLEQASLPVTRGRWPWFGPVCAASACSPWPF